MGTTATKVDTAMSKVEGQLELWSTKLKELLAKSEVAGHEAKLDARKHLDELKAKVATARIQLDAAKAAGGETWSAFKSGVESSVKELEEAFYKLAH